MSYVSIGEGWGEPYARTDCSQVKGTGLAVPYLKYGQITDRASRKKREYLDMRIYLRPSSLIYGFRSGLCRTKALLS